MSYLDEETQQPSFHVRAQGGDLLVNSPPLRSSSPPYPPPPSTPLPETINTIPQFLAHQLHRRTEEDEEDEEGGVSNQDGPRDPPQSGEGVGVDGALARKGIPAPSVKIAGAVAEPDPDLAFPRLAAKGAPSGAGSAECVAEGRSPQPSRQGAKPIFSPHEKGRHSALRTSSNPRCITRSSPPSVEDVDLDELETSTPHRPITSEEAPDIPTPCNSSPPSPSPVKRASVRTLNRANSNESRSSKRRKTPLTQLPVVSITPSRKKLAGQIRSFEAVSPSKSNMRPSPLKRAKANLYSKPVEVDEESFGAAPRLAPLKRLEALMTRTETEKVNGGHELSDLTSEEADEDEVEEDAVNASLDEAAFVNHLASQQGPKRRSPESSRPVNSAPASQSEPKSKEPMPMPPEFAGSIHPEPATGGAIPNAHDNKHPRSKSLVDRSLDDKSHDDKTHETGSSPARAHAFRRFAAPSDSQPDPSQNSQLFSDTSAHPFLSQPSQKAFSFQPTQVQTQRIDSSPSPPTQPTAEPTQTDEEPAATAFNLAKSSPPNPSAYNRPNDDEATQIVSEESQRRVAPPKHVRQPATAPLTGTSSHSSGPSVKPYRLLTRRKRQETPEQPPCSAPPGGPSDEADMHRPAGRDVPAVAPQLNGSKGTAPVPATLANLSDQEPRPAELSSLRRSRRSVSHATSDSGDAKRTSTTSPRHAQRSAPSASRSSPLRSENEVASDPPLQPTYVEPDTIPTLGPAPEPAPTPKRTYGGKLKELRTGSRARKANAGSSGSSNEREIAPRRMSKRARHAPQRFSPEANGVSEGELDARGCGKDIGVVEEEEDLGGYGDVGMDVDGAKVDAGDDAGQRRSELTGEGARGSDQADGGNSEEGEGIAEGANENEDDDGDDDVPEQVLSKRGKGESRAVQSPPAELSEPSTPPDPANHDFESYRPAAKPSKTAKLAGRDAAVSSKRAPRTSNASSSRPRPSNASSARAPQNNAASATAKERQTRSSVGSSAGPSRASASTAPASREAADPDLAQRPFVLAYWEETDAYYPGRVGQHVGQDQYRVDFLDKTSAVVSRASLRMGQIRRGDTVCASAPKALRLAGSLTVLEDWGREEAEAKRAVQIMLNGKEVLVKPSCVQIPRDVVEAEYGDRQLSAEALKRASPPIQAADVSPKAGPSTATPRGVQTSGTSTVKGKASERLAGLTFLVTSAKNEEHEELDELIRRRGGTVCEKWSELFATLSGSIGSSLRENVRPFVVFQGDTVQMTAKMMAGLAAGIPVLSAQFVSDAGDGHVDWRNYLISAGPSRHLGQHASQVVDLRWANEDWDASKARNSRRPFAGKMFFVLLPSGKNNNAQSATTNLVLFCLSALGSTSIVQEADMTSENTSGAEYILVNDNAGVKPKILKAFREDGRLCNVQWLKECIIVGAALPPARL